MCCIDVHFTSFVVWVYLFLLYSLSCEIKYFSITWFFQWYCLSCCSISNLFSESCTLKWFLRSFGILIMFCLKFGTSNTSLSLINYPVLEWHIVTSPLAILFVSFPVSTTITLLSLTLLNMYFSVLGTCAIAPLSDN